MCTLEAKLVTYPIKACLLQFRNNLNLMKIKVINGMTQPHMQSLRFIETMMISKTRLTLNDVNKGKSILDFLLIFYFK